MSDRALKNLIMIVVVILVLHQFVSWAAELGGAVIGVLAALLVVVVSFFCGYRARAGEGNIAWFMVPVLLFAVVPTGVKLVELFANEKELWVRLWGSLPFVVGFLVPIGTLLVVYWSLGRGKRRPAAPLGARD